MNKKDELAVRTLIRSRAGARGGKAAAVNLTKRQRSERARKAAEARWAKKAKK